MPVRTRSQTGNIHCARDLEEEYTSRVEVKTIPAPGATQVSKHRSTTSQRISTRSHTGKLPLENDSEGADRKKHKPRLEFTRSATQVPRQCSASFRLIATRSRARKLPTRAEIEEEVTINGEFSRENTSASHKVGSRAEPARKVQGRSAQGTRDVPPAKEASELSPTLESPKLTMTRPSAVTGIQGPLDSPMGCISDAETVFSPPQRKVLRAGTKRKRDETYSLSSEEYEIPKRLNPRSQWKEPPLDDQDTLVQLPPQPKRKPAVTTPPTTSLQILVCGTSASGELGLGVARENTTISIPRLNHHLDVGIVNIACGGSHCIALARNGEILTWGWNKDGALGRETDFNRADEDKPDRAASKPGIVRFDHLYENLSWVQVVATNHASFALSADGRVFGWGTFYDERGMHGFSPSQKGIQRHPVAVQGLSGITNLAAGAQHVLAINKNGVIFAWGINNYGQLGERKWETIDPRDTLRPRAVRLPGSSTKAEHVACGLHSSFALDQTGRAFSWGRNDYAQLGTGYDEDVRRVAKPRRVKALKGHEIVDIAGGKYHSLACDDRGRLLVWGRCKSHYLGLPEVYLEERKIIFDQEDEPLVVTEPSLVKGLEGIVSVTAGKRHSIAINVDGVAYTFGRSVELQTGQGTMKPATIPGVVSGPDMKRTNVYFAVAGEDFSVFAGVPRDDESADEQ